MSVAVAAGYPQYAGVGINYIPQLFAPKTLIKFYASSVVPAISNTDYEGVIKDYGDKVTIRTRPNISVRPYVKGQELEPEVPESVPTELLIDQAEHYDFVIDVVDEKQADIVLDDEFTTDAGEQMRVQIDTNVLGSVYSQAHASNQGATAGAISAGYDLGVAGSPLAVTSDTVTEVLTSAGAVLDEQNVPDENRALVIPVWMRWMLINSELKFAYLTGDDQSIMRNGLIGMIDRWKIYASNLLSVVTDGSDQVTNCIACHSSAITFAAQLVKNEVVPATKTFGKEYRGLQVYGFKTVKPESIAWIYAKNGS